MAKLNKVVARLREQAAKGDNRTLITKVLKKLPLFPAYSLGYYSARRPSVTEDSNPYRTSPAQKGQAKDWKEGFSDARKVKAAGLWSYIQSNI